MAIEFVIKYEINQIREQIVKAIITIYLITTQIIKISKTANSLLI